MKLTKPQNITMWASVLLGLSWILYRLLNNTGWILDDEICHYRFSASVWENSDQLFNHWTRPGRNLLHCFAAPFGFTATRIYTLALAMLSVLITFKVGKILKVRALWAVPLMLMFQSWFPELSYPVLTQAPFMLVWVLGVWLGLTKRWHMAGFCFGYLSLIRHEGILLTAIWGIWVICNEGGVAHRLFEAIRGKAKLAGFGKALGRDLLYGVSTVSAIILYNLAAFIFNDSIPFQVYFESNPTDMYGSGTIYHYVPLLVGGIGFVSTALLALGVFGLKGRWQGWSLLIATYPVYFALHALIYWQGAFASGGYYHFIMPMAPFIALLCAEGYTFIRGDELSLKRNKLSQLAVVLFVAQGLNMTHHQICYQDWAGINLGVKEMDFRAIAKPMVKGELSTSMVEASNWAVDTYPEDTLVLAKHIAHVFTQGHIATREQITDECMPLYKMPLGTVYIWDYQYCQQENRIKYTSFAESQDWKPVKKWLQPYPEEEGAEVSKRYMVIAFEKVSAIDTADKVYEELGEADKVDKIYE